jgi:hypothetical protein
VFSDTAWSIAVSFNRRYQFDAGITPGVAQVDAVPQFLLDRPRRMDVVSIALRSAGPKTSAERTTFEVTPFMRWFRDRAILDPQLASSLTELTSGVAPLSSFDFMRGSARSRGISISTNSVWRYGRGIQLSYTLARTEEKSAGGWHPSSWDATHTLATSGVAPLPHKWSLTAAWTARSGLPTTPVISRVVWSQPFYPQAVPRIVYGPTNSARLPAFSRADVGVRRSWGTKREWTFSAQVVNILHSPNVIAYRPEEFFDAMVNGGNPIPSEQGVPLIPTVGLAVRW